MITTLLTYDPDNPRDRFRFQNIITRLTIQYLTRTAPFRPELVEGAYWLARQLEETARRTPAS